MKYVVAAVLALSLLGPAVAGSSMGLRYDGPSYGPETVTINGIDWRITGEVGKPGYDTRCQAEQPEQDGVRFVVGRNFSGLPGMFFYLPNMGWAAPLSEKLPMKTEVRWASWSNDVLLRVGILDGWMTVSTGVMVLSMTQNDIDSLIGPSVTKVKFAVPDNVVRPGGAPKLWIKGFGPQLTAALNKCYAEIGHLPHFMVDR